MKTISKHNIAKLTLIVFYIIQVIFASAGKYRDWSIYPFAIGGNLIGTTLILIPALITYQNRKYIASTAAALVLVPFVVYANIYEYLLPYKGGGASMAYVIVFFFGVPLSVLLAFIFSFFEKGNGISTAR